MNGFKTALRIAIVLLFTIRATANAQDHGRTAGLDSIVRAAQASMNIPGLSVAVMKGSDTLLFSAYGYADLENQVTAAPHTVYNLASVTKQYTAAAILRLAERGRLSLEDTLQKFFPDYPTRGNRITIRHLLNHTSGIRSFISIGPKWQRLERYDIAPDSMVALFSSEPFDFPTGSDYRYNNSGYFLLGLIIEKVSGKSYAEFLKTEFFQPLGLAATYYCEQAPIIRNRARGYAPLPEGGWRNAAPMSMAHPFAAGALCSTMGDQAAWTRALFGGRVIGEASLRQMVTGDRLLNGKILDYGYGIGLGQLDGRREFSHSGGINGFASYLAYYPDDSVTVAVLTNSESANATVLGKRLARFALGIAEFKPKDLTLRASDVARVSGSYQQGELVINVTAEGGRVFWRFSDWNAPERLLAQGGGVFVPTSDADVRITFTPSAGTAQRITVTQGGQTRLDARRTGR